MSVEPFAGAVTIELFGGPWDGLTLWVEPGGLSHPPVLTWRGERYLRSSAWHNEYAYEGRA